MMDTTTMIRRVLFWFCFYSFTVLSVFAWIVFKITIKAIYRDL
jgi:hypothetical protein